MQLKINVNLYLENRLAKDFFKLRMVSAFSVSSLAARKKDVSFRPKALIRDWDLLNCGCACGFSPVARSSSRDCCCS